MSVFAQEARGPTTIRMAKRAERKRVFFCMITNLRVCNIIILYYIIDAATCQEGGILFAGMTKTGFKELLVFEKPVKTKGGAPCF
jgi:hypothetical protein